MPCGPRKQHRDQCPWLAHNPSPPAGTQGLWLRSRQPVAPTSALDMAAESPLDEVLLDALPRSSKNILLENVAVEPASAATATTSV